MKPVTGDVRGHVTVDGGEVSGVMLALAGQLQTPLADGSFHFAQVPPGPQHLTATKDGYVPASADVTVQAGETATQDLTLAKVPAGNHLPKLASFVANPTVLARAGHARVLVQAADEDGDALTYAFAIDDGWTVTAGTEGGTATITAPDEAGAEATLNVEVTDGKGGSAKASLLVSTNANRAPVITSLSAPKTTLRHGEQVPVTLAAFDPDGSALTYQWTAPEGWNVEGNGASVLLTAPDAAGTPATLSVKVTDADGAATESELAVSVAPNAAPEATLTADANPCGPGQDVHLTVAATDADRDELAMTWTIDAPWTIDGTGAAVIAHAPAMHAASAKVTVSIDDGHGGTLEKTLELRTTANAAPVIASLSALPPLVHAGQTLELRATASDTDGEALTYTWTVPDGWTLAGTGAVVTLTSPAIHGDSGVVSLEVKDPNGASASANVAVATMPNNAPILTAVRAAPSEVAPGGRIQLSSAALDADGDTLTYQWTAPEGWTFDGPANAASATLVAPNAHDANATVTLTVSDGSVELSAPVFVGTTPNHAPVVANLSATGVPAGPGAKITLSSSVSDPDGDTLTYTWKLPAGWTAQGTGATIQATAPATKGASGTATLTVSDGALSATASVPVSTEANHPPTIASLVVTGSPAAKKGVITLTASASDVDRDTLTYSWEVPAGWFLSGNGAQVTVTAPDALGQSGLVKVTVNDAFGGSAVAQAAVATAVNGAPVINSITANPPVVTRGGTVVVDVSAVDPDGDALTYTWTVPTGWTGSSTSSSISITAPNTDGKSAEVTVVVSDGALQRTARVAVSTPPNRPPSITSVTAGTNPLLPGAQTSITVAATDPENDTLTYGYTVGAGWSIVGSGATVQVRAPFQNAASTTLTATVTDAAGNAVSSTLTLTTSSCTGTTMNCDGSVSNGCETDLANDSTNCGVCANQCSGSTPACINSACTFGGICSNGSSSDCNPAGTTLITSSRFVDPNPPAGWTQCAGFLNTAGDDITANALNNCLSTTRLRIKVWNGTTLEEDITVTGQTSYSAWPSWNYLGGTMTPTQRTYWGYTTFFTDTTGRDACGYQTAPSGVTFGTGNGSVALIAGGNTDGYEYRVNCSGTALIGRKVALYK